MRHHWRLAQIVGAIRQVFPHQVLGKGEHRQHDVFAYLPAPDVFDCAANTFPDACNVQTGLITRQVASGNAQLQLEVLPQHLDQRGAQEERLGVGRRTGFQRLDGPMGSTGHFGCNRFYLLDL